MTMPHRAALLALFLLAAASSAAAACTDVNFKVDLINATTGFDSDPIAKCLSSFRVTVTSCQVTVTPLAAADNYVAAMWGTAAIAHKMECPATARSALAAAADDAAVPTAIADALNIHIYGNAVSGATVDGFNMGTPGRAVVQRTSDGDILTYAVTESSNTTHVALATCANDDGTDCKADLAVKCETGAYGVVTAAGKKICALCPAGTYSDDGIGCTPCDPGTKLSTVGGTGANSCSNCLAGSYAQGGNSDCLLCPAGTAQAAEGQGMCDFCNDNTWALHPGMTKCLKCVNGVPADSGTPSAGYHVLSLSDPASLGASCNSTHKPLLTTTCAMTSVDTLLSVFVDYDCSVTITPIKDPACSEPGSEAYEYAEMAIQGYYTSDTEIKTLLPTVAGSSYSSSYLLALSSASGNVLTMAFSSASTDPAQYNIATDVCTGSVTVDGGVLAGAGAGNNGTNCPDGSYSDTIPTQQYCPPCPVGKHCSAGAEIDCDYDKFNPLLGQSAVGSCQTCNATADPRFTSLPAAQYCTVPYVDMVCGDGTEYDDAAGACVPCADGYKRDDPSEAFCVPCLAGTAKVNGTTCTACTDNTVAPVDAMNACVSCPVGSVTNDNHTECTPCGPGTVQNGTVCSDCDDGFFRSGDATPENNVCKKVPAGFRAKVSSNDTAARSEIELCDLGTFSAWSATNTRVPADPTLCQACSLNTYAPRTGMQKCLACKAGTIPSRSAASLALDAAGGPDQCTTCAATEYRAAFMASENCTACAAGSETGPSNHAACTPCRPGYVNNAAAADCAPCGTHTFQSMSGQTTCRNCPVGYEGDDSAAIATTECSPCARGYYNNVEKSACKRAPAGTFVNTTGAITFTPCSIGTFSAEDGSDICDSCPPGQYANTRGSKACKTCPAGTFSAGRASSCISCKPGYFANSGSGVCSPCKPGYYASTARSTGCAVCPIGKQCALIATAIPATCPKGYFSNKEGARLCTPCPANTYQPGTSPTQCIRCPAGRNTRGLRGQSVCQVVRTRPLRRLSL